MRDFDESTEKLLRLLKERCVGDFYKLHRDLCIAVMIATSNIRGRGIVLRPSLLKLEELSDKKVASYVFKKIRAEVGPVASSTSLKHAAASLVFKKLGELL
ncbi:MAG: hypothetical protein ABWK05_08390 [Pyrobaculum sp.]